MFGFIIYGPWLRPNRAGLCYRPFLVLLCCALFYWEMSQIETLPFGPSRLHVIASRPFANRSTGSAAQQKQQPQQRPFYNIAHMVNSLKEIDEYLKRGANALETDVYFAPNATPVFTFHGYPCDCFRHCVDRERIETYLTRIRELTTPNSHHYDPRLLLLFLDLKLLRIAHSAKALAGQNLAATMAKYLYNETEPRGSFGGTTIKTVISIDHVFDYDFILGFQNELESQGKSWLVQQSIGWDVGMNDPIFAIESLWKRIDTIQNIWQGDGRSNCVSPFYNLGRLSSIIKRRDQIVPHGLGARTFIRKVYQWTVDLTVNIRTAFRSNVDAIITNHPERILHVMKEREFINRYRMANGSDSPWERVLIRGRSTGAQSMSAVLSPTLGLKVVNGAGDMIDSFSKYIGDFLRHQSPTRYLYLSSYSGVGGGGGGGGTSFGAIRRLGFIKGKKKKNVNQDSQNSHNSNSNQPIPIPWKPGPIGTVATTISNSIPVLFSMAKLVMKSIIRI